MASAPLSDGLAGCLKDTVTIPIEVPGECWETVPMWRSMLHSLGIHAGTLHDELNRTVDLDQFHVVHLENIDGDLAGSKRKQCQQFNYRRPLPPFQSWGSRWFRLLTRKTSTGRTARAKRGKSACFSSTGVGSWPATGPTLPGSDTPRTPWETFGCECRGYKGSSKSEVLRQTQSGTRDIVGLVPMTIRRSVPARGLGV